MLIVIVLVMASGCIRLFDSESTPLKIYSVCASVSLNYTEVASVNYTKAENDLEALGYNITTHLSSDIHDYFIGNSYNPRVFPHVGFSVSARTLDNGTKSAEFSIGYHPLFNESCPDATNVELAKQHTIEKANEIAQICNLTLNWDNAKWTVNYAD